MVYGAETDPSFDAMGMFTTLSPWTETPPLLYSLDGEDRVLISNAKTISFALNEGKTIFDDDYFDTDTGKIAVWSNAVNPTTLSYNLPDSITNWDLWKTVYYNPYSVFPIGDKMISILHGENKNNFLNDELKYTNTVKAPETVYSDEDYSSSKGENWANYFAFLTSASANLSELAVDGNLISQDNGPIIWPDNGYLKVDEEKISSGLRHPSSIIYDDFLYVFYIENIYGGKSSLKVARSPVSANAMPGSFMKYYNGSFSEQALPENFDKNDRNFVYEASGKSTAIIESRNPIKFAVAKLIGTPYFIGVLEETGIGGVHYISLSVSSDLVNWSTPKPINVTQTDGWANGNLHYPVIYSNDFSSNMEVSKDDFYIVGTSEAYGGYRLPQYLKLSINVTEK